jgi:putative transposase
MVRGAGPCRRSATGIATWTAVAPGTQRLSVVDQITAKVPKLASSMDEAGHDAFACMGLPKVHRAKVCPTKLIERLNGEIKRPTKVVGVFPNDEAIMRLVGTFLPEQNDGWAVLRSRRVALVTIASLNNRPALEKKVAAI